MGPCPKKTRMTRGTLKKSSCRAGPGLRRASVAALVLLLGWDFPAVADSINLAGVVPAKSGVRLVQRQTSVPMDMRQPLRDFVLFSLVLQTNNRLGYTFSVLSDNARDHGNAALVDPQTGNAIPYSLKLGDQEVRFEDGKAVLNSDTAAKGSKSEDLKISTGSGAGSGAGQYGDRLTLVMSFN